MVASSNTPAECKIPRTGGIVSRTELNIACTSSFFDTSQRIVFTSQPADRNSSSCSSTSGFGDERDSNTRCLAPEELNCLAKRSPRAPKPPVITYVPSSVNFSSPPSSTLISDDAMTRGAYKLPCLYTMSSSSRGNAFPFRRTSFIDLHNSL